MNFDPSSDPRAEKEMRLTAFLLGELSEAESARIREALASDAELARLHDELQRTIGLVRDTAHDVAEAIGKETAPLRLADERRQQLLAHFKTARMPQLKTEVVDAAPYHRVWGRVVFYAAAAACVLVLASLFLPAGSTAKAKSQVIKQAMIEKQREFERRMAEAEVAATPHNVEFETLSEARGIATIAKAKEQPPQLAYIVLPTMDGAVPQTPAVVLNDSLNRGSTELKNAQEAESLTFGGRADNRAYANGALYSDFSPAAGQGGQGGGGGGGGSVGGGSGGIVAFNAPSNDDFSGIEMRPTGAPVPEPQLSPVAELPTIGRLFRSESRAAQDQSKIVPSPKPQADPFASACDDGDQPEKGMAFEFNLAQAASAPVAAPIPADRFGRDAAGEDAERHLAEMDVRRSNGSPADKGVAVNFIGVGDPEPLGLLEQKPANPSRGFWSFDTSASGGRRLAGTTYAGVAGIPVVAAEGKAESAKDNYFIQAGDEVRLQRADVGDEQKQRLGEMGNARHDFDTESLNRKGVSDSKTFTVELTGITPEFTDRIPLEMVASAYSPVTILSPATTEPASPPTMLSKLKSALGGSVERSARLSVEGDLAETERAFKDSGGNAFDPYSLTTPDEKVQSSRILNRVTQRLEEESQSAGDNAKKKPSMEEAYRELRDRIDVTVDKGTGEMEIRAKGRTPEEAAKLANLVAETYRDDRNRMIVEEQEKLARLSEQLGDKRTELAGVTRQVVPPTPVEPDPPAPRKPAGPPLVPQPEVLTRENAFSTFSLNVSDVSFKLAAASLAQGQLPDASSIRSEEFINALNYRDPEPVPGAPLAFAWERARDPFAHNRDLLRFSVKTAALGRQAGIPLNLVLLLDNSGSMERADRVRIVREALRVLAGQLQPQDKLSVITFARTPRLWVDGVSGAQANGVAERVGGLTPQGGTNLEEAMRLAYATARRHYLAGGNNHVVLLTDGAANLGDVDPASLDKMVETHRKQGIALDCFGIGWEGYNDDLLEVLARHGDGRYGFINSPAAAGTEFAAQLAGALQVAASDVKVQVEFNPARVTSWRQIGYAKHQLTKEQFRDNTVDAAELTAKEAGNALYAVEVNPAGEGPIATVRARFRIPGTRDYREHAWDVPFNGAAPAMDQAPATMRLATASAAFAESLASSPFAAEVTSDRLLELLRGVSDEFGADPRPKQLEQMIRQAKAISGNR